MLARAVRHTLWISTTVALGLSTGCAQTGSQPAPVSASASAAGNPPITTVARHSLYELRTYTTNEGKLDALHARFRDHTRHLFERHGIQNVAYWTPTDTPNTLIYIVAHKSRDTVAASWASFVADPEWQEVYANSIADGGLVANIDSVFMTATDYSPEI